MIPTSDPICALEINEKGEELPGGLMVERYPFQLTIGDALIRCELGYRRVTAADMKRTDFFVVVGFSETGEPKLQESNTPLLMKIEK